MKTRFNKYGDSADGRHVSEFENDDLTTDELWQKLSAANESGEDEIEESCRNEIAKRIKQLSRLPRGGHAQEARQMAARAHHGEITHAMRVRGGYR
jgi:hypothetical protein